MIPYSRQSINEDDINEVIKALKSDYLTCGKRVDEFEKAICDYIGVKYALVLNSATSALHLAYICSGIKKDEEFITTPITFAATSSAGLMVGAKPVFCDVKSDGNIDEKKIEELINKNTKVITPVDFGGMPLDMDFIMHITKKHELFVINDASHAFGSIYEDGKKVGSKAHISVFSFHAIKPITTFEGGALVTNDEKIYQKALKLRSHNLTKIGLWDSHLEEFGYNYRLSDVACALGLSQLKRLENFIKIRENIASYYDETFKDNAFFKIIKKPQNLRSSRHLYPILLNEEFHQRKEEIFKKLHEKNIGVQVNYKPLYQYDLFKQFCKSELKNAEIFYKSELSIPNHQLMSLDDAKYISQTLLEILQKMSR